MTNAMTCREFEALVPGLLDGEIEMSAEMRAHVDGCAACRSLLADLRAIEAGAAALPPLHPQRDLWSGIAARIEAPVVPLATREPSRGGQRQMSWRAAGIAAAALVVATTAITYRVAQRGQSNAGQMAVAPKTPVSDTGQPATTVARTPDRPLAPTSGKSTATTVANNNNTTTTRSSAPARIILARNPSAKLDYDREIVKLRAIVDSGRTRLDPATVALLERNLRVIDSAIVQCRDALAKDPASSFLSESLNNAYQTKVKLLRIAAAASTE